MSRIHNESTPAGEQAGAPSNAELEKLIEKALVRFENWKTEMERNPNPRTVHTLKNVMAIIESVANIADGKMKYSYKRLNQQMAVLLTEVAQLNMAITNSLQEDDYVDERELQRISSSLVTVVQSAVELIKTVQTRFGSSHRQISFDLQQSLVPEDEG
jgi:hypothetical protein